MNLLRLTGSVFLLLALSAVPALAADRPATQPDQDPATQPSNVRDADANREPTARDPAAREPTGADLRQAFRALGIGKTAGIHSYSPQEWDEMMAFLKVNSPTRYAVLSSLSLSANSPIRFDLIRKWRNYIFVRDHFPAMADNYVKRFELEDGLFLLVLKARRSGEASSSDLHDRIRSKIGQLVDLGFDERQIRIAKLEELLNTEKKKLAEDQDKRDALIDQRTDSIIAKLQHLSVPPHRSAPATRPVNGQSADEANSVDPSDPKSAQPENDQAAGDSQNSFGNTPPLVDVKDQPRSPPPSPQPIPVDGAP
jgi:hypothetical protein